MTKKKEMSEFKLKAPAKKTPITEITDENILNYAINDLAKTGRNILDMERERDDKIAQIKTDYEKKITPLKYIANSIFESVVRYATKHRKELLPSDRKSAEFTNGTIGWKYNPPSIKLNVEEEIAVAFLKAKGHQECIQTKEVVDKQALAKNPALARSLPIVEYNDGAEYFFTAPHGVQVSFMRRMKALATRAVSRKRT